MNEFSLIEDYFSHLGESRKDVELGVGDDAAVVNIAGQRLCVAVDTLISGVHFPITTSAEDIAFKSLAVNLSDMAAMGARPAWATLALSITDGQDQEWVRRFSESFNDLARRFGVQVIGGDTTRSSLLTLSVQIMGLLEEGEPLRRSAAKVGDSIFVTGCIGDAGIGLRAVLDGHADVDDYFLGRLNRPTPRVEEALSLKEHINAAIDISDGFIADLGHILQASGVGASIELERIPLSAVVKTDVKAYGGYESLLSSGDDYELCFTVSPENVEAIEHKAKTLNIAIQQVGLIERQRGLRLVTVDGNFLNYHKEGFDHFVKE